MQQMHVRDCSDILNRLADKTDMLMLFLQPD